MYGRVVGDTPNSGSGLNVIQQISLSEYLQPRRLDALQNYSLKHNKK